MYIRKNFSLRAVLQFSGWHIVWLTVWAAFVAFLYDVMNLESWFRVPWLPVSLVGTAVAFYVGFKNNSSYDRMWEARKIWGAIVNSSRAWGTYVKNFVTDQFSDDPISESELHAIHKKLIYRHIGWLYALRSQLLIPTPWEHVSLSGHVGRHAQRISQVFGKGLFDDEYTRIELQCFLPNDEYDNLVAAQNTATQIIDEQGVDLQHLRKEKLIDDFRHMELQKILYDFYEHQGKCERIKKFPLPRQYGGMSVIFVGIFIFLMPFGMVSEFAKLGEWGTWFSVPFTVLVCWVFLVMELVGDYSANPFAGLGNDIPMLSLCRVIEIDLREMLGETELPPPIQAKSNVLM